MILSPVHIGETPPKSYWLCPECYQWRIDKLARWKKEGCYHFHQTATTGTIEQFSFDNFEEYVKSLENS